MGTLQFQEINPGRRWGWKCHGTASGASQHVLETQGHPPSQHRTPSVLAGFATDLQKTELLPRGFQTSAWGLERGSESSRMQNMVPHSGCREKVPRVCACVCACMYLCVCVRAGARVHICLCLINISQSHFGRRNLN